MGKNQITQKRQSELRSKSKNSPYVNNKPKTKDIMEPNVEELPKEIVEELPKETVEDKHYPDNIIEKPSVNKFKDNSEMFKKKYRKKNVSNAKEQQGIDHFYRKGKVQE